jgi:acid stress-induced BolA-like protein IbaG/YrbA
MNPTQIQQRIEERLPGSQVTIRDLTGTADHWEVTVISPSFLGKPILTQHRIVKGFFDSEIASGELHAFSLKTYTPDEWNKKSR